jgi:hypothetical protein
MANNLIQIKRSLNTANPGSLANGELAYTANGDVLYIGSNGQLKAIAGARNPGTLTANQALVVNASAAIDEIRVANLVPTKIYANSTHGSALQLLASGGSSANAFWYSPPNSVTGSNTEIQFNDSGSLNASAGFIFTKDTNNVTVANTLIVGNTSANAQVNSTGLHFGGVFSLNSTAYTGTAYNANNTTYVNTKLEGDLNVNNALTANDASYLGGTAAASYVQNTDSRILSGNLEFTGANNFFTSGLKVGSNVVINTSALYTGNTIANLIVNSTIISIANSSKSANLTPDGLAVGIVTINSSSISAVDATFTGNLTVQGTLTTVDTINLQVKDSMIKLADQQTAADALSIGFYGQYGNSSVTSWSGLFRDQGDSGVWKFFHTDAEPSGTVNTNDPSYIQNTLRAYLTTGGSFVANSTAVNITANSTVSSQITANSMTLTTALNSNSGGTGQTTYTQGDILYYNTGSALTKLGIGTDGFVLQVNSSSVAPYWGSLDGGTF